MSWLLWVDIYLIIGILLGEGLMYHNRKTGTVTRLRDYLIALLLGPSVGLIILLVRALTGGRKLK